MRMLDLYCGEGLAAWGYWLSGRFSEIVGVDIHNMKSRYSFDFIQSDALALDYEFFAGFDFVHASPPCQAYSKATPRQYRVNHPRLIAATHLMLNASGLPYVIENVEGSGAELRPNFICDGGAFGLPSQRRRYFHISTLEAPQRLIKGGATLSPNGAAYIRKEQLISAMGLNAINPNALAKMTIKGIEQGVPPQFTRHIAGLIFEHKVMLG